MSETFEKEIGYSLSEPFDPWSIAKLQSQMILGLFDPKAVVTPYLSAGVASHVYFDRPSIDELRKAITAHGGALEHISLRYDVFRKGGDALTVIGDVWLKYTPNVDFELTGQSRVEVESLSHQIVKAVAASRRRPWSGVTPNIGDTEITTYDSEKPKAATESTSTFKSTSTLKTPTSSVAPTPSKVAVLRRHVPGAVVGIVVTVVGGVIVGAILKVLGLI